MIGKIARLFPLKGHEFVWQIAPALVQRHPDVVFLFVGVGILRHEFEQRIARKYAVAGRKHEVYQMEIALFQLSKSPEGDKR